jgi:hypothetical protein
MVTAAVVAARLELNAESPRLNYPMRLFIRSVLVVLVGVPATGMAELAEIPGLETSSLSAEASAPQLLHLAAAATACSVAAWVELQLAEESPCPRGSLIT